MDYDDLSLGGAESESDVGDEEFMEFGDDDSDAMDAMMAAVATAEDMHAQYLVREAFEEAQVGLQCAMHAAHNAVGSDADPALSHRAFVDATEFHGHARTAENWGTDELGTCFSASTLYDSLWLGNTTMGLVRADVVGFLQFAAPYLCGFIIHESQPQHWVALRCLRSSHGLQYQHVDSVKTPILGRVCTLEEAAQHVCGRYEAGHAVICVYDHRSGQGLLREYRDKCKERASSMNGSGVFPPSHWTIPPSVDRPATMRPRAPTGGTVPRASKRAKVRQSGTENIPEPTAGSHKTARKRQLSETINNDPGEDDSCVEPRTGMRPAACDRRALGNVTNLRGGKIDVETRLPPGVCLDKARSRPAMCRVQLPGGQPAPDDMVVPAPLIQPTGVSLHDPESTRGLLQMAFPSVIFNDEFDYFQSSPDGVRVPLWELLRHMLRTTDADGHRPAAEHPTLCAALVNVNMRMESARKKYVIANRYYEGKSLTELQKEVESGDNSVFQRVKGFTSTVAGSKGSWSAFQRQTKNFVFFMEWLEERVPTVFFTVTPADNWWPSFHTQCLPANANLKANPLQPDLHPNQTPDSDADTINRQHTVGRYVCLAAQYFWLVFQVFLHGFLREVFDCCDYLFRAEMQQRANAHWHGMSYHEGAPSPYVLQRACDGLQRYTEVHHAGDPTKRAAAKPEEDQALQAVLMYCDTVLQSTGNFSNPVDGSSTMCPDCMPAPHGKEQVALSNAALKTPFHEVVKRGNAAKWQHLYDLKARIHVHEHRRSYCLVPRRRTLASKKATSVKLAPRKDLKCRFEFFFRVCRCPSCLQSRRCPGHAAEAVEDEAARAATTASKGSKGKSSGGNESVAEEDAAAAAAEAAAHAAGNVFMDIQCVCDAPESSCRCRCGNSCKATAHGSHICVTRSSKDEPAKRKFRLQPARNHSGLNCHVDAVLAGFGMMVDIQFIANPGKALEYTTKYVVKAEKDSPQCVQALKSLVLNAPADTPLSKVMGQIYNGVTCGRDIGDWEMAMIAQGIPLSAISRPMVSMGLGRGSVVGVDGDAQEDLEEKMEKEECNAEGSNGDEKKSNAKAHTSHAWYANRPVDCEGGRRSWYWCSAWCTKTWKKNATAAMVNFTPHRKRVMPDLTPAMDGEDGPVEDGLQAKKLEEWCQHRLVMFITWRNDSSQVLRVQGGAEDEFYATYRDALWALLPPWVTDVEAVLKAGVDPDFGVVPDPPAASGDHDGYQLPQVVVREVADAIRSRGYYTPDEADGEEPCAEECAPEEEAAAGADVGDSSSDSEDDEAPGGDVVADGGSSCDEADASALLSAMVDDGSPSFEHYRQLQALVNEDHDWTTSSVEALAACDLPEGDIGCRVDALQKWLQVQKACFVKDLDAPGDTVSPDALCNDADMNQRAVHDHVVACVTAHTRTVVIVQGPAGCGKSFLFKGLRYSLGQKVVFLAPTGVAALLIRGRTIHSAFRFRPRSKYRSCAAGEDGEGLLVQLQELFKGVEVLVFDEMSMISRTMLGMVYTRLGKIFPGKGPFGGMSVLFCGDNMQLPPVCAEPMWSMKLRKGVKDVAPKKTKKKKKESKKETKMKAETMKEGTGVLIGEGSIAGEDIDDLGVITAILNSSFDVIGATVWRDHFTKCPVFVMRKSYRQRSDPEFGKHVANMRGEGLHPGSTIVGRTEYGYWMNLHCCKMVPIERDAFEKNALWLVDKNSEAEPKKDARNVSAFVAQHEETQAPVVCCSAVNTPAQAANALAKLCGGALPTLHAMVGMRVMLIKNEWTCEGLVNGSFGVVVGVVKMTDSNPEVILVQFGEQYTGPSVMKGMERVVPIVPSDFDFVFGRSKGRARHCKRVQFPLVPAWAITIHKSQGMTVGPGNDILQIVVDVGDREWAAGLVYVAVSRAMCAAAIRFRPERGAERWSKVGMTKFAMAVKRHLETLDHRAREWALGQAQ